jgi:hypothetical protein
MYTAALIKAPSIVDTARACTVLAQSSLLSCSYHTALAASSAALYMCISLSAHNKRGTAKLLSTSCCLVLNLLLALGWAPTVDERNLPLLVQLQQMMNALPLLKNGQVSIKSLGGKVCT